MYELFVYSESGTLNHHFTLKGTPHLRFQTLSETTHSACSNFRGFLASDLYLYPFCSSIAFPFSFTLLFLYMLELLYTDVFLNVIEKEIWKFLVR